MPELIQRQLSGKDLGTGASGIMHREEGSPPLLFFPLILETWVMLPPRLSPSQAEGRLPSPFSCLPCACCIQGVSSNWKPCSTPCLAPIPKSKVGKQALTSCCIHVVLVKESSVTSSLLSKDEQGLAGVISSKENSCEHQKPQMAKTLLCQVV